MLVLKGLEPGISSHEEKIAAEPNIHPSPPISRTPSGTEENQVTLWPPDVKSQLIGKNPDAGKD